MPFQLTAARRRLAAGGAAAPQSLEVSTHSRPKAAGEAIGQRVWMTAVSTHSRPKAAGTKPKSPQESNRRFNSQPPEGGWAVACYTLDDVAKVSTHSRPKAAGRTLPQQRQRQDRFNSQPPEGGWPAAGCGIKAEKKFQLTAARRRLGQQRRCQPLAYVVSTHSRPKAAGYQSHAEALRLRCFNSQPPEGGWAQPLGIKPKMAAFQLTAARRRLE